MLGLVIGLALVIAEPIIVSEPEMTVAGPAVTVSPSPGDSALAKRGFAGLGPQIAEARRQIDSHLSDYSTARFRDVRFGVQGKQMFVCGQVNAKNRFGAYAGWTVFYVIPPRLGGEVRLEGESDFNMRVWEIACRDLATAWITADASAEIAFRP